MEVEPERFPRSAGERDLDSFFIGSSGDAESGDLAWLFSTALTGDSSSSSDASEPSEPVAGSWETDLDLGTYQSLY